MPLKNDIINIARSAKEASRKMALLDSKAKERSLVAMADSLEKNCDTILKANKIDIKNGKDKGLSVSMIERLTLNKKRIGSMATGLRDIAALKDAVGEVIENIERPNGLRIEKVRVPIGVIAIIYESRPNVTSDCAGLCLKSGNSCILKGGSTAINSNMAIFKALKTAAKSTGLPDNAINLIESTDRKAVAMLLEQDHLIDLVMPRGGEGLIREVVTRSRIPVIKHYKGICHLYVDEYADLNMAHKLAINAKVQRPSVCNAMETLLVHKDVAARYLPVLIDQLRKDNVEIRGCNKTKKIVKNIKAATEKDWSTEYLDLILSIKVVSSIDEAIDHINRYGSMHSDTIVTQDKDIAQRFLRSIDSACVYHNASTRFTDGGEFGMGAEIGISTDKLHARGPMGIRELTSYKYIIYGNGQIRT